MEYLFDTANLEDIKKYSQIYKITGVTSNPSIVKAEGKISFFEHFKELRKLIGIDKSLHIQVVSQDYENMLKEADIILKNVDDQIFIKIPTTEDGLKAMHVLKSRGINVTATAIYSKEQGFLAMEAGADFIAPYFNRMENMNIDPRDVISSLAEMIEKYNYKTKILAASFKNIGQVNDAFLCGAQTATVNPALLHDALSSPLIQKAVDDFASDWSETFGVKTLLDL